VNTSKIKNGSGTIVGIFTALLTVAIVAVIVSQHAQTASILQALGSAAAVSIGAATAPVTGGGSSK
jgi:hypothetical protein